MVGLVHPLGPSEDAERAESVHPRTAITCTDLAVPIRTYMELLAPEHRYKPLGHDFPSIVIWESLIEVPQRQHHKLVEDTGKRNIGHEREEDFLIIPCHSGHITLLSSHVTRNVVVLMSSVSPQKRFMSDVTGRWTRESSFVMSPENISTQKSLPYEPSAPNINFYIRAITNMGHGLNELDSLAHVHVARRRRIDGNDGPAQHTLAANAFAASKRTPPHLALISFGGIERPWSRAFPVHLEPSKTHAARKKKCFEKIARRPFVSDLAHWNVPRVTMDSCPSLNLRSRNKTEWLSLHFTRVFSEQRHAAATHFPNNAALAFENLKRTIGSLLLWSIEYDGTSVPYGVFGLCTPDYYDVHTVIFVNDFRLDPCTQRVLADACVLPVTWDVMPYIRPTLQELERRRYMTFTTPPDEVRLWSRVLPVLAECCAEWEHGEECEYRAGAVSVGEVGVGERLVCQCGMGRDLGWFGRKSEWREVAPYVTRVVLDPLFIVELLDTMAGSGRIYI